MEIHPDRSRPESARVNEERSSERLTGSPRHADISALTKEELQKMLFARIGISKIECREIVNALFEEIRAALAAGETVKLEGFGRFQPRKRPQRWARNLHSGERIMVSERRVVTFHPSRKLTQNIRVR